MLRLKGGEVPCRQPNFWVHLEACLPCNDAIYPVAECPRERYYLSLVHATGLVGSAQAR